MRKIGAKHLLLDTNAVIDYFKGNGSITGIIRKAKTIYIPAIVLGELYYGASNSSDKRKHTRQINRFLSLCEILYIDGITAQRYGVIKAELRKKGRPIPENDIWIAALAKQHSLPLLSNDQHYKNIDKFRFTGW